MATSGVSARVSGVAGAWLALAVLVGGAGLLRGIRPPLPQMLILALTVGVLLAWRRSPTGRTWALTVDLRTLVLIHVTRFVGIYFLVLYGRGELPYAFAVPGGVGDIVVAAAALALALGWRAGAGSRRVVLAWNVLGLVDILLVVATAARLAMADPGSMGALLSLPLSLLPTFLVPIIIATHILIFVRLAGRRGPGAPRP